MMTEADEDRILTLLNQLCEVIGGICRELGIPYGGVDDDYGEIVGVIRELKHGYSRRYSNGHDRQ